MERPVFVLIFANEDLIFVAPKMEVPHLLFREVPGATRDNIISYDDIFHKDQESATNVLLKTLFEEMTLSVLVEPETSSSLVENLEETGIYVKVDATPFVKMLQAKRGMHPAEKILMDSSLELAEVGMNMMLKAIAAGQYQCLPLFSIAGHIKQMMMSKYGFHVTTCSALMGPWPGPESFMEHYIPHLRDTLKPEKANILFMFTELYRYYAELEQLVFIGQPPQELRDIFNVVREATQAAIKKGLFRGGVPVSDIDWFIYNHIKGDLGSEGINHRSGHMILTEHHFMGTWGGITRNSSMKLMPGCRYAWEPGFSHPKFGTVRGSVPFDVMPDGTVKWLRDPGRPIEDFIIPKVNPVRDESTAFMEKVQAAEEAFRKKLQNL